MVGSAILRNLEAAGYTNFVLRTSSELDLRNQQAVADFFEAEAILAQIIEENITPKKKIVQ
jgi:nucleoside-diphosphate-sugar epimerase